MKWWTVPCEWPGETVFIIGGGPSVGRQDLTLLRGRRVIAINSSYQAYPDATFLVFHDDPWWRHHRTALAGFRGRIVCPAKLLPNRDGGAPRLFLRRTSPELFPGTPQQLALNQTCFVAAINLAVHLGAARVVLLGADGRLGAGGETHHHPTHPRWAFKPKRWVEHNDEFRTIAPKLRVLGVTTLNASPGSAYDAWPIVELKEVA